MVFQKIANLIFMQEHIRFERCLRDIIVQIETKIHNRKHIRFDLSLKDSNEEKLVFNIVYHSSKRNRSYYNKVIVRASLYRHINLKITGKNIDDSHTDICFLFDEICNLNIN
jgi:hypothetical protein